MSKGEKYPYKVFFSFWKMHAINGMLTEDSKKLSSQIQDGTSSNKMIITLTNDRSHILGLQSWW